MTSKKAAEKVEKMYPGRIAQKAYKYKTGYIIFAEYDSPDGAKLYTDPWFYVNALGAVRGFNILENLDVYDNLDKYEVPID